jgi:hypothetical protein
VTRWDDFSHIGRLFIFGQFLKNNKSTNPFVFWAAFFNGKSYVLFFTKKGLGYDTAGWRANQKSTVRLNAPLFTTSHLDSLNSCS